MTNSSVPRRRNGSAQGGDGVWDGAEKRPLAVVTGASSGIGYNLARLAALNGYDLVVASDEGRIRDAARNFTRLGANVRAVEADLATEKGVETLYEAAKDLPAPVEVLFANAGRTLGDSFLNQDWREGKGVINTNVFGTAYLLHKFGRDMRERGQGRLLITGSVEGYIPGTEQALYNATKAFVNSFAVALRHELMGRGITVTCLLPGATDTEIFARGGVKDTILGKGPKSDALAVALTGFDAMMRGEESAVHGLSNKIISATSGLIPPGIAARIHGLAAAPLHR
jgi:short-subunit dehydrogenase